MRLFMKSFISHNNNLPFTATPHVHTQQHCSITTLTHQLAFQSQQSLHHHSLNHFESTFFQSIHTVGQPGQMTGLSDYWKEYMGIRDWEGLLDPLDENLAHEILRYGNFVETTYRAFEFDPGSPLYGSCKYKKRSLLRDCGVPCDGYRITRHLRATSGIQVPEWARSSWAAMQSSWIGYVAVSNNKAVIDRLGRREVVIALRGTATCLEWFENMRTTLAPAQGSTLQNNGNNVGPWSQDGPPMVESGFLSLYTSSTDMWPSLQDAIRMEISHILKAYKHEPLSITITGHSLGAALATLAAHDIKTTFDRAPLVTVISFGGPRVGNKSFRSLVDKQGTKILRVVNPSDLITKVPGFLADNNHNQFINKSKRSKNHHYGKIVHIKHHHKIRHKSPSTKNNSTKNNSTSGNTNSNSNSNTNSNSSRSKKRNIIERLFPRWTTQLPHQMKGTHWWVYAEVGHELRLETEEPEELPFYLNNMNVAKCHDLKTYLNLVEGCPLKALVKRSLKRFTHRGSDEDKGKALAV